MSPSNRKLAAQSLVDVSRRSGTAKHAIDVVEQSQSDSPGDGNTRTAPTTVKRNDQFLKALEELRIVTRNTGDVR